MLDWYDFLGLKLMTMRKKKKEIYDYEVHMIYDLIVSIMCNII